MRKLPSTFVAVAAEVFYSTTFAATDCTSTYAAVTLQAPGTKPTYLVELDSNARFVLSPGDAGYREFPGLVKGDIALAAGRTVARFAADGVNCTSLFARTDLISLRIPKDFTLVTTTSPAPVMAPPAVVVEPPSR